MEEKSRIYKKLESVINCDCKKSTYIGEDDFVSLVKDGITINFHIKHAYLDLQKTFRIVKRTQKIVKDRFDLDLETIDIDIYNSMDEMRQDGRSSSRYASWIAGIYDGKIRVISEDNADEPEALYIILTHEIIHLAIGEISKGQCPYWMDEGLAVFISQGLPDDYLDVMQRAVRSDKTLPLEFLEKPIPANVPGDVRLLAYSEASSIAEYLIETCGWDKIKTIIAHSARRPVKAILADMSLNYYLLEQAWKRWLRGK